MKIKLVNDSEIASMFSMSTGLVGNQRWRRKLGEDQTLMVDPVMIGSAPRYRLDEFRNWIGGLEAANE